MRIAHFAAALCIVASLAGCGSGGGSTSGSAMTSSSTQSNATTASTSGSTTGNRVTVTSSTSSSTSSSTATSVEAASTSSNAEASTAAPTSGTGVLLHPTFALPPARLLSQVKGYTPAQIRHAYGVDQIASDGTGQIIAVIDAYGSPTLPGDFATFCAQYNLPDLSNPSTLHIATPQGAPGVVNQGWALETSLDVEWAHAVAPGAQILLVVARSNSVDDLMKAVDYATNYVDPQTGRTVAQVSMSFGGGEFRFETLYDSHFQGPGVTYLAASGDGGAGTLYPAASPDVLSVGGTTLDLDPSTANVLAEVAWPESGGGPSQYETEASGQYAWQGSGVRETPDVSWDANPVTGVNVYDSVGYGYASGAFVVGGTSVGAPSWAAVMAITNSMRTNGSVFASSSDVYALGSPASFTEYFRDITVGTNQLSMIYPGFACTTGYDEVTGLGSPFCSTLIPGLVNSP